MSDGDMGMAVYVFLFTTPPGGGVCVSGTPPVRSMTGPACAAGCVLFYPGPMPGLYQPGACAVLMPAKFCRPVPGGCLDERTAGRHVCHNCVNYEQKFNFSAGRPPDRRKAKNGPAGFLCYI